jgi:hypothetical protein
LQNDVAKQPQELIDLNELDEEQLKQLQTDENQAAAEVFQHRPFESPLFPNPVLVQDKGKETGECEQSLYCLQGGHVTRDSRNEASLVLG